MRPLSRGTKVINVSENKAAPNNQIRTRLIKHRTDKIQPNNVINVEEKGKQKVCYSLKIKHSTKIKKDKNNKCFHVIFRFRFGRLSFTKHVQLVLFLLSCFLYLKFVYIYT